MLLDTRNGTFYIRNSCLWLADTQSSSERSEGGGVLSRKWLRSPMRKEPLKGEDGPRISRLSLINKRMQFEGHPWNHNNHNRMIISSQQWTICVSPIVHLSTPRCCKSSSLVHWHWPPHTLVDAEEGAFPWCLVNTKCKQTISRFVIWTARFWFMVRVYNLSKRTLTSRPRPAEQGTIEGMNGGR